MSKELIFLMLVASYIGARIGRHITKKHFLATIAKQEQQYNNLFEMTRYLASMIDASDIEPSEFDMIVINAIKNGNIEE